MTNMSSPEERVTIAIESVNEAGGLLRDRVKRLVRLLEKHTGQETEGVQKSLVKTGEYLEDHLAKSIRKAREKTDSINELSDGILKEESLE
mgnify:CR=1 FL=1